MCSCSKPFLSLGKVFWLAGSLLIIGLASVVNPTMGWRWLIRIASITGILLILVFKVGKSPLPTPCYSATALMSPQALPSTPCILGLFLCPFSTSVLSPSGLGRSCSPGRGRGDLAGDGLALHRFQCPGCQQYPGVVVMGQTPRGRQDVKKDLQSNAGHSTRPSVFTFSSSLSKVFTECQGKPQPPQASFCFRKISLAHENHLI